MAAVHGFDHFGPRTLGDLPRATRRQAGEVAPQHPLGGFCRGLQPTQVQLESVTVQRWMLCMQLVALHSILQPCRRWRMLKVQAAQTRFIEACNAHDMLGSQWLERRPGTVQALHQLRRTLPMLWGFQLMAPTALAIAVEQRRVGLRPAGVADAQARPLSILDHLVGRQVGTQAHLSHHLGLLANGQPSIWQRVAWQSCIDQAQPMVFGQHRHQCVHVGRPFDQAPCYQTDRRQCHPCGQVFSNAPQVIQRAFPVP
ncbi:hypothetical protein D3C80_1144010 [compost metagenome]